MTRGDIFGHRDFEHRGDFDDLGEIDRNLGSIKLKILTLKGKTNPEAYLDWKKRWKWFLTSIGTLKKRRLS